MKMGEGGVPNNSKPFLTSGQSKTRCAVGNTDCYSVGVTLACSRVGLVGLTGSTMSAN